jgi:GAF domain-containing protein
MTPQDKLNAVIRSARAILERGTFEETARVIFDQCRALTGAQSGYVALLTGDGQENEVLFLDAGGLPCTVDPDLPMPIRGLRALAYETHKPVYDNDFMNSRYMRFMPEGHVAMRNVLFAPLNLDGRTVGIIGIANKPSDFTDEDADTAALLGELAAIALRNSRAIERMKQKAESLQKALADVRTLRGLLPICACCKKIRDDQGYWNTLETYLRAHSEADFTHSYCDECSRQMMQGMDMDA